VSALLSPEQVAAIAARHAAAELGYLYPAPEPFAEPGTVRATIDGYPRTVAVMDFRGWKAEENRQFVLYAHGDVHELLEDRARFADRADMAARIGELEFALSTAELMLHSVESRVRNGQPLSGESIRQDADALREVLLRGMGVAGQPPAGLVFFRAWHEDAGMTLGRYASRQAAMDHVHHTIANEENTTAAAIELRVIWRADDPDAPEPVWECWLLDEDEADDRPTGYTVGPFGVAAAFDAEAES
jgi:hypothetical protein